MTPTPDNAVRLGLHQPQAAVYADPTRFRVLVAGRRFGKTRLAITELVTRALRGEPGRYWYVGPDRTAAKDTIWEQLKATIDPSWLAGEPMESELSIPFRHGAQIAVKGAEEPNRLRGRGLRYVVLDEYADMKPEAWTAVLRPQLADYKAPALFIGTPRGFNHLYDLWQRGQAGGHPAWKAWQFRSVDNPLIDPQEIEDARHDCDERTFREEWEASFEAMSGRAYYAFTRGEHVAQVNLDPAWPVCLCFDFNIDPACAVIYQRFNADVRVWREAKTRHSGGEATRATAKKVRDLLASAGHHGEVRIYGDASGKSGKTTGPSDHAVLRELFPGATWCIPSANPHVRDRVSAVNSRLRSMTGERHMTVDPSCVGVVADLEQVIFAANGEIDKKSNPELTHLSDALGYGIARDFPVRSSAVAAIHGARESAQPSATLQAIRAAKSASLRAQLEAAHHG